MQTKDMYSIVDDKEALTSARCQRADDWLLGGIVVN